ncbi:hypothetical protein HU200_055576 [Digitaria exilis]|uniref:KIB1-4 beta-propeller domain-containing protein n=1 Tax=Digitaria exilis TaxID=1010633 RepID=A0A835ANB2_9POAL|nr:hypothetical protein HU200_055576 [Digitaria exilis]
MSAYFMLYPPSSFAGYLALFDWESGTASESVLTGVRRASSTQTLKKEAAPSKHPISFSSGCRSFATMESKAGEDPGPLAAAASSFPLLVYDHGEPPGNSQTVLSTLEVPEMRSLTSRYMETPQGLVLMVDTSSQQCSLWNPQTGDKTALPAMDEPLPEHCRCLVSDVGSSSPPPWVDDDGAAPDSLVLVYDLTRPQLLFCRIRGGVGWAKQAYDVGLYEVPGKPMTVLMGMFFYLDPVDGNAVGTLVGYAGEPEQPSIDAPLPDLCIREEGVEGVAAIKSYILGTPCSGELFLVRLVFTGPALDHIHKVDDIGDAAFLLGPGGFAASRPAAAHGLRRGCVYFACDDIGDSNDCHVFDLMDGTRELIRPTQDIPVLSREPFWLVPVLT